MATAWVDTLRQAKKTAVVQSGHRKVHYLLQDGRELVEEYNMDTNVVTRRAWREKGKLGQDVGWQVEVGDPEPQTDNGLDKIGIRESSTAPFVTRRITKTTMEWRIRNLPYLKDVYSVTAEEDSLTVRTTNKKYFKRIKIPDLERIHMKPEQERISFTHQFNTLIIMYKKPVELLNMEKIIVDEAKKVELFKGSDVQCPIS